MKLIHKSYKYRLYPNKKQRTRLHQHFGATRFVWNHFLAERKRSYLEDGKSLTYYDCSRLLTSLRQSEEYPWLRDIGSISLQASLQDLDSAYGSFFQKKAKFPKFKSRKNPRQSFRCRQNVHVSGKTLRVPKFQEGVKFSQHRPLDGRILFVTISVTPSGKYFASITCEVEHDLIPNHPHRRRSIGIDLGIKTLITCSDGKKIQNPKELKACESKLKYEQRQLSKKTKGSNAKTKQRRRVALVHERISNKRLDYINKITTSLIKENAIIVAEDLDVKGMMKNHRLAKHISDASWNIIMFQLKYKSDWNDRDFIQVNRIFPSSKMCSACSFINQELSLGERSWSCPSCGATHDRDINASKNILKQGLKILSVCGMQSDIKQKSVKASGSKQSL